MTPARQAVADLDRALADAGEPVRLRRSVVGPQGSAIGFEVTCRGFVRGHQMNQLAGSIGQQDIRIVLSPTEITRSGWPGAAPAPAGSDKRIPRQGDQVVTGRGAATVQSAAGVFVACELVRIEVEARGRA